MDSAFKASIDQHLNSAKKEDLKFLYDALLEKACFEDDENIRKKLGNILGYSEGFVLGDRFNWYSYCYKFGNSDFGIKELGEIYRDGRTKEIRTGAKKALKCILNGVRDDRYIAFERRKIKVEEVGNELGYSNFRIWLSIYM